MATLLKKPYPLPKLDYSSGCSRDWKEQPHYKEAQRLRETRDVIEFGVADGSAVYLVVSLEPRVRLQHVPEGDGYQVPYATIRGLRKADVEQMLEWSKLITRP